MSIKLSQNLRVQPSLTPQDISSVKTGSYVDVSGCQRVAAAVTAASIVATKKLAVQLMQAQDTGGTGAKVLGSEVDVVAPTGGAPLSAVVDAEIESLDFANGFDCIAVRLSSDNGSAVYGSGMLILGGNRFNP